MVTALALIVLGQSLCRDLPSTDRLLCGQIFELRSELTSTRNEIRSSLHELKTGQDQIDKISALHDQRLSSVERSVDRHETRIESLQRTTDQARGDLFALLIKVGLITGVSMGGVNVGVSAYRNRSRRRRNGHDF